MMLIDLNSTHGSLLNKQPLKKEQPAKLNVGDIIQFGKSQRLYIYSEHRMNKIGEDEESSSDSSEQSLTELSEYNYHHQLQEDIYNHNDDDTEFDRTLKTSAEKVIVHDKESLQILVSELEKSMAENESTRMSLLEKKSQLLCNDADPLERSFSFLDHIGTYIVLIAKQ